MLTRECENCLYFTQEELGTGFCQSHEMYVFHDFDCEKFTIREMCPGGGEAAKEAEPNKPENV